MTSNLESIGPFTAGQWRVARKKFQCMHHYAHGQCCQIVAVGDRYYDTNEGAGFNYFRSTKRFCADCAEACRYPIAEATR